MSEKVEQIFNNLVTNDKTAATVALGAAMREKLNDAYEVRKVNLTSTIFNKKEEES